MTKTLNQFCVLLVIGCLFTQAYSKSDCATFYTDVDLGGDSFDLSKNGNIPAKYNDKVSSFNVPEGFSVTLYTDVDYKGKSYGPYAKGIYNVPSEFNDQLSSIKVKKV